MLIAIMGLLASIAMILLGVAVIGRRGELATQHSAERVREVEANVGAEAGEQSAGVGVEVSFFQGVRRGFAFYGEKSTATSSPWRALADGRKPGRGSWRRWGCS